MPSPKKFDRPFFIAVVILVVIGFFIFSSASLGLLAREGARFSSVAFSQIVFGIIGGTIALAITANVHYRTWRRYALYLFIAALVLTSLVFIPGIGFSAGGARRWLDLGPFSFQPGELLKLAFVIYFAAWLSGVKEKVRTFAFGLMPFGALLAVVGALLLLQPDTGTLLIIATAGTAMFFAAGARWRDLAALLGAGVAALSLLVLIRPYLRERIMTFFDPSADPLGTSYQLQQSLIAIGSGEWTGRGFGQSIQKFNFLPEPIGDSIFAVAAEEFGFFGSVMLIFLFLFLAFRGLKIAARSPDLFGGLTVLGIVILILTQSFLNIGSMLGLVPLTGEPLTFVSHGGSALFIALAEVGIILNISKFQKGS